MDLFNKKKVKGLVDTISCLMDENADLRNKNKEKDKYIEELETSLETALNDVKKGNARINSLLTEAKLLKNEILKLKQQIELKESQRRKMAGKVGGLMKEKNKLNEDLEYSRDLIKDLNHENYKYRSLYNTKKEVREYGKTKSERN